MTRSNRCWSRRLTSSILLCGCLASASLADVAHLRNGRTLTVSGFRVDGGRIVLAIEGGGEVTLPSAQVLSIERAPLETAPAAAPAPTGAERPAEVIAPPASAPAVVPGDRASVRDLAARTARKYGVDERLVLAVIEVESRYDARALSPRGAMGLMQLMPETAARFAVRDPYDPSENVEAGVRYLRELLDRYSGQPRLALAAYNAGEEAVEHFSGIPPFQETIHYVERVLRAVTR